MPIVFDAILPHVVPWVLVLSRMGGLFLLAPLLSSEMIPRQARLFLLLALTGVVYPLVDTSSMIGADIDLYSLGPMIACELLIGGTLGLFALIPLVSVQLGGLLMGQQMGLGIAQIVNPATNIEGDNVGQILFMMTMAGFVVVGGLELLVGGVIHSFEGVPLGGLAPDRVPLDLLVGLLTSGFELAIRVAMPVLLIIFLENVAVGFLMKTVPSLNIMNFGFPLRIILGLFVLTASLGFIAETIGEGLGDAVDVMTGWIGDLRLDADDGFIPVKE